MKLKHKIPTHCTYKMGSNLSCGLRQNGISQGQPRVTIWTNLVVLSHPMLYTKLQGNQPSCSEENFLRFLPYMGIVAIFFMRPGSFEQIFNPPMPGCCGFKFDWNWPCGFREEVVWKSWRRQWRGRCRWCSQRRHCHRWTMYHCSYSVSKTSVLPLSRMKTIKLMSV